MRDRMFGMGFTRRSGGGGISPPETDADAWLFLEAAPSTTGAAEGGTIQTWTDLSVNVFHATQATEAKRPTLQLVNGVWVVRFDGTSDSLLSATGVLAQPHTFAVVAKKNGTTHQYFITSEDTSATIISDDNGGATGKWRIYSGTELKHTATQDESYHTFIGVFNGASSAIRVDGVEVTGGAFTVGLDDMRFGARTGGLDSFLNGDIHAIVGYDSALSTADREAIEAHYASRVTALNT